MNINRLHPTASTFWDEIDHFFNHALAPTARTAGPGRFRVKESDEGWTLQTDLPGYTRENVEVAVENGFLRVDATPEEDQPGFADAIEQRVRLSPKVDAAGISARLEHGVLEINLPRKEATPDSNIRIEVN